MLRPRTTLQAVLTAGGTLATVAGLQTVISGARSIPGKPEADALVESELRFYGAFYAATGLAVLHVAPRAEQEPRAVRAIAAAVLLAGLARAGGWVAAGAPHPAQRALLAIELALPPAIVALQRKP